MKGCLKDSLWCFKFSLFMILTLLRLIHLRIFKDCVKEILHEQMLNLIKPVTFRQVSDFSHFFSILIFKYLLGNFFCNQMSLKNANILSKKYLCKLLECSCFLCGSKSLPQKNCVPATPFQAVTTKNSETSEPQSLPVVSYKNF